MKLTENNLYYLLFFCLHFNNETVKSYLMKMTVLSLLYFKSAKKTLTHGFPFLAINAIGVSAGEASLANPGVSNQEQFQQQIILFGHLEDNAVFSSCRLLHTRLLLLTTTTAVPFLFFSCRKLIFFFQRPLLIAVCCRSIRTFYKKETSIPFVILRNCAPQFRCYSSRSWSPRQMSE